MKSVFSIVLLIFTYSLLNAQTVLLEQNPKKDTIKRIVGQNLKHFIHVYGGISFAASPSEADSVQVNYGLSNCFSFGIRYKRKICNAYAIGYNLSMATTGYNIKQDKDKRFIDDSIHKKEKLILTALSFEFYNRINFGKRGNIIGKYIDLGVYGNWNIGSNLYLKDYIKLNGQDKATPYETNTRRLYFIDPFGYGACMRFGFNRYTITAEYRISNMFKKSSGLKDLPRLFIGLQFGFF